MNKIINNLKTTLSSLFQNIKRKKYLQGLIGKHGQIIEKDDKIIVNVNPKKIKKQNILMLLIFIEPIILKLKKN